MGKYRLQTKGSAIVARKGSGNSATRLTKNEEKYVQCLLKDMSQRVAYRAAYPNCKASDEVVDVKASQLLAKDKVRIRYNALHDKLMAKAEQSAIMSAEEVLKELSILGRAKIDDYLQVVDKDVIVGYEDDNTPIKETIKTVDIFNTDDIPQDKIKAVSEIKQTRDGISLKLNDKLKALETLGRHWGLFVDNVNQTGDINISVTVDEEE